MGQGCELSRTVERCLRGRVLLICAKERVSGSGKEGRGEFCTLKMHKANQHAHFGTQPCFHGDACTARPRIPISRSSTK